MAATGSPGPVGTGPPSAAWRRSGRVRAQGRPVVATLEVLDDPVDDPVAEATHLLGVEAERVRAHSKLTPWASGSSSE